VPGVCCPQGPFDARLLGDPHGALHRKSRSFLALDVKVELCEPGGAVRAKFKSPVVTKLPAGGVNVL
jgi:hypothetical protein